MARRLRGDRFPSQGLEPLEAERVVHAPVDTVWGLLSDLRAMGERSPETVRMFIARTPKVGSRGLNVNRRGPVVWPTTTRVTRWKPPAHDGSAALAFHVGPTDVEWSYELTPVEDGTLVVERRTGVARPTTVVKHASRWFMGGAQSHDVELLDGMHRTLAALAAEAEAAARR
ncbi:MAG: SRPBCC family protein [Aeromicrobium erythreum]